jgi:antitoxin VapB
MPPRPPRTKAKLFWTGRSQAVRLPKQFRFTGDTVVIRRDGNRVILEPDGDWPEGWFEWLESHPVSEDFVRPPQGRPTRRRKLFP